MTVEQLNAIRPKPPCGRDCADRKPGCGADCEKWKAYETARAEWYAKKLKASQMRQHPVYGRKKRDEIPALKKRYPGRF